MKNIKFKTIINVRGFIEHYCLNHRKRDVAEQQLVPVTFGLFPGTYLHLNNKQCSHKMQMKGRNIVMGIFFTECLFPKRYFFHKFQFNLLSSQEHFRKLRFIFFLYSMKEHIVRSSMTCIEYLRVCLCVCLLSVL